METKARPWAIDEAVSNAANLIERCRAARAEWSAAEAEYKAIHDRMPAPDVVLSRSRATGEVVFARSPYQVDQHFDRYPESIFTDRETYRAAKQEELRQWQARWDTAAEAMGLHEADQKAEQLSHGSDAAFEALCDYEPQSWPEARQIAAYVISIDTDDRWMACDLLDAWSCQAAERDAG